MAKYFDEGGEEVEAFTQEEVNALKEAALEEAASATSGKDAQIAAAQAQIDKLTKDIAEAGMPEAQKKRLKEAKDVAEEVSAGLRAEIDIIKSTMFSGVKNRLLSTLAKDEDSKTKITAKYDSLMKTGEYAQDEGGISRAMGDAATLVTGVKPAPGFLDNVSGSGSRGDGSGISSRGPESDSSIAQRKLLGISDEEASKFAPKN